MRFARVVYMFVGFMPFLHGHVRVYCFFLFFLYMVHVLVAGYDMCCECVCMLCTDCCRFGIEP